MWHRLCLIVLLAAVGLGALAWKVRHDPTWRFLPRDSQAEWILFPTPISPLAYPVVDLDTIFRREFELTTQPRSARLEFLTSKRVEIQINGAAVLFPKTENWKTVSRVDVLASLRPGTNVIEAKVFNNSGPPALWVVLTADNATAALRTDGTWEASLAGSAWRPAALATDLRLPRPGNPLAGGERLFEAMPRIWSTWLIMLVGAIAAYVAVNRVLQSRRRAGKPAVVELTGWKAMMPVAALALLWCVLFWNNATLVSRDTGFDATAHVAYIQYVKERWALPLPTEGFEMFHPPLYYVMSAVALSLTGTSLTEASGLGVLRVLTMLFGIVHFGAVFFALRLLFPRRLGPPLVGMGLAAFLPMHLYMSHYITNETLAAALDGVAIYIALRLILQTSVSVLGYMLLGVVLGAAMLTKVSAIFLVLPLLLVFATRNLAQRASAIGWLKTLGTMSVAFFAVCGWHYIRTYMRFATPFVWSGAGSIAWWQDPGYRTFADYIRFGRSLWDPFVSSRFRFWDGIYSTVWGDGLNGANIVQRPPWNYNLMAGGYVLALAPTALIVIGFIAAVYRWVRRPAAEIFLLVSFSAALLAALILLSLNSAAYSAVKGFYGLSALVPISFFAALGWRVVTRSRPVWRGILACLLLTWAANSFASVWIRASAARGTYAALQMHADGKLDAAVSELSQAVDADPADVTSRRYLGSFLAEAGRPDDALDQARLAVRLGPDDGANHLHLAGILAGQGQTGEAVTVALRARDLAPENPFVYEALVALLLKQERSADAVNVGLEGLCVTPSSAVLHERLAEAFAREQDVAAATRHREYARMLQPQNP